MDLFSPKSTEEYEDLKQRGWTETAGKWKFRIDISDLNEAYEEDEDTEEFRQGIISKLENAQEDVEKYIKMRKSDDLDTIMMQYEEIIDEFRMLDEYPEPDEVDYPLGMLYDFADEFNIWIESMG
jgi:hypothetical protein